MLNNIVGGITITIVNFYIWTHLLQQKVDFKSYKTYLAMIILSLLIILNYFFTSKILSLLLVIVFYAITLVYVFKISLKNSLIMAIITQFLYIIAESLVILLVVLFLNIQKQTELIDMFFGTIYANISVSLVALVIGRLKIINKAYNKMISILKEETMFKVLIAILSLVVISSSLFYCIYYTNSLTILIFLCTFLTIGIFVILMNSMLVKNNYLNMHVKYNNTIETLKSYEDILDKYKVSNHENKNQLLMIRNMLVNDDKSIEITKYIDNIVKNDYLDDEKLMIKSAKIPAGGLRALIYSKILYMKNNNINFELTIDKKIKSEELINIEQDLLLDICKIIGVFIDNAIEEIERIDNGSIGIELYMLENKINIAIANVFEGFIDLEKIDEIKYTTKGNGHGYGLALVKEIINNRHELENSRMINDNVFIQVLKISV